jgi:hypothetical protein
LRSPSLPPWGEGYKEPYLAKIISL